MPCELNTEVYRGCRCQRSQAITCEQWSPSTHSVYRSCARWWEAKFATMVGLQCHLGSTNVARCKELQCEHLMSRDDIVKLHQSLSGRLGSTPKKKMMAEMRLAKRLKVTNGKKIFTCEICGDEQNVESLALCKDNSLTCVGCVPKKRYG